MYLLIQLALRGKPELNGLKTLVEQLAPPGGKTILAVVGGRTGMSNANSNWRRLF